MMQFMESLNKSEEVIFNHFYKLRHDHKRIIIHSPGDNYGMPYRVEVNLSWISKIHPVYGILFSFLSKPIKISKLFKEIAYFLEITEEGAQNIITPFFNQTEPFSIEYGGETNLFPKNIIINASQSFSEPIFYSPKQFLYEKVDLKQERFYTAPLSAVFMINNTCVTNCVYCYADRSVKNKILSFDRLKSLIANARNLDMTTFFITGGEFFLYKEWKNLLDALIKYGYKPGVISTKMPLNEDQVIAIKQYNITIQISLDAITDNLLNKILKVKNGYAEKIKESIILLEKHSVKFQIATVLTSYNDSISNLETIHKFINNFKFIQRWELRLAFKSLYSRGNFNKFKVSKENIPILDGWIQKIKLTTKLNIAWDISGLDRYFKSNVGSKGFIGSRCSANYSNIVILPDGKVTICEQLYWNPRYIIGDLMTNSIEEVWNSPRSLELAFPKIEDFRDQSTCKHCNIFEECYSYANRCIIDVLKGYGEENWDYPDPRCIKAPSFIHELRN